MSELWDRFFKFEEGKLTQKEITEWYVELINTGYVWKLPHNHLLNAITLLENGVIGSDYKGDTN